MEDFGGGMIRRPRQGGIRNNQIIDSLEIMAENRALFLPEQIDSDVSLIISDLRVLASESKKPIKIEIVSYGGEIAWVLALYHTMSALNNSGVPIYTVGHVCYSGAALILAAGARGYRYLYPEGIAMIHATSLTVEGKIGQADMKIVKKNDKIFIDLFCKLCRRPDAERKNLFKKLVDDGEEMWFDANEAMDFDLVDGIVTPEIDRQLFGNLDIPTIETKKKAQ